MKLPEFYSNYQDSGKDNLHGYKFQLMQNFSNLNRILVTLIGKFIAYSYNPAWLIRSNFSFCAYKTETRIGVFGSYRYAALSERRRR